MASISSVAPSGSAATWTVARGLGFAAEVLGVDGVDAREQLQIHQIDRGAHDVLERRAGRLEHRAQIREHTRRLGFDFPIYECIRLRVERDLTRDEDPSVALDGLGVGTDRCRSRVGADLLHASDVSSSPIRRSSTTRSR